MSLSIAKSFESSDLSNQTIKLVFKNEKHHGSFEMGSYFDEESGKHDICLSIMAGCYMKCLHCATTHSNNIFERNLYPEEVISQIEKAVHARRLQFITATSLGYMGNGEFFGNFNNATESLKKILEDKRFYFDDIGISTIGFNIKKIRELADIATQSCYPIFMQYSALSMDNDVRQRIMPNSVSFNEAIKHLDQYAEITNIPVKYNFPLIKGINDSGDHIEKIKKFVKEKPSLRSIKLSTYNEFPKSPFRAIHFESLIKIAGLLEKAGLTVQTFRSDLNAGCGVLRKDIPEQ